MKFETEIEIVSPEGTVATLLSPIFHADSDARMHEEVQSLNIFLTSYLLLPLHVL